MKDGNMCLIRISRPIFPHFSGFRLHLLTFIVLPKTDGALGTILWTGNSMVFNTNSIQSPLTGLGFNASHIRTHFAYRDTAIWLKHCHHSILLDGCNHSQSNFDMIQSSKLSGLPALAVFLVPKVTMACLNDSDRLSIVRVYFR